MRDWLGDGTDVVRLMRDRLGDWGRADVGRATLGNVRDRLRDCAGIVWPAGLMGDGDGQAANILGTVGSVRDRLGDGAGVVCPLGRMRDGLRDGASVVCPLGGMRDGLGDGAGIVRC
jgi:hypothetical protein